MTVRALVFGFQPPGHYYPVRWSPRFVVFGSRWGEVLALDRATLKSYHAHSDASGEECDTLAMIEADHVFDAAVSELVECAGSREPLPPSVARWVEGNPCQNKS